MKILIIVEKLKENLGLKNNISSLVKVWSKKNEVLLYVNEINEEFKKEFKGINLITKHKEENARYIVKNFKPQAIINYINNECSVVDELKKKMPKVKLYTVVHKDKNVYFSDSFVSKNEKFIAISKATKSTLKMQVPPKQIEVIYSGINMKEFYPTKKGLVLQKKLDLNPNWKTVVIISNLTKSKLETAKQAIRVMSPLAERLNGLNVIVCVEGEYLNELKEITKSSNNKILKTLFVGQVKNLRSHINLADLVLSSNRTAIESLLCNKKVFYMAHKWKCLVENSNFEDILFSNTKYTDYTDAELLLHLTWMLKKEDQLESILSDLMERVTDVCDVEIVAKKYMEILKEK